MPSIWEGPSSVWIQDSLATAVEKLAELEATIPWSADLHGKEGGGFGFGPQNPSKPLAGLLHRFQEEPDRVHRESLKTDLASFRVADANSGVPTCWKMVFERFGGVTGRKRSHC